MADIDTEGVKDKATGRLQSVTKRAPELVQLRGSINRYAWVAHSSHGHDPQRLGGVIKYRIVFPLSRDCTPEEWSDVWQGLNTLLGGHCDGACKDVARLYYLPSSPPDTAHEAFFVSNEGEYLDPDYLITLGRQTATAFAVGNLSSAPKLPLPLERPEEVARVKSMLAVISADCNRETWRNVVWSLAATGWTCAKSIAREWSQTAPERFSDAEFGNVWKTFDPTRGIGLGSLVHLAKNAGWVDAAAGRTIGTSPTDASGDIRNGQAFAYMFRDKLLFVHETNSVLVFDQRAGWVEALPGEEDRAGKQVIDALRAVAAEQWRQSPDDPKTKRLMAHVERSSSARSLRAMIDMAKSELGMTVRMCELDADPMLLGVANGVLDLRTSKLLPLTPALRATKRCSVPFEPLATAPTLDAFIQRVTRGVPNLAPFLQRLAGYVLTGEVDEQCFAFLYGLGRNGKTTFAELLFWLLGDYAVVLPTATLMLAKRDPAAASPDLMLLKGRRLALASELEENARFAEAQLKALTGGDTMQARNPYGSFVSWTPTHKLMIVGNHKPVIAGGDLGIWRRVRLIPFAETISAAECDERLLDKLRAEGAGVLNWALAGLRDWRRQRLAPPAEVKAAAAAYQTDMDTMGQWMDDHVATVPGSTIATAELYKAYSAWARESGWKNPMTRQAFGRRLGERGIALGKMSSGTKCAHGIALNDDGKRAAARLF